MLADESYQKSPPSFSRIEPRVHYVFLIEQMGLPVHDQPDDKRLSYWEDNAAYNLTNKLLSSSGRL